jgi:hypothetical protein
MKFLGTDIQRQSDSASAFAGGGSVDPLDLTATIPAAPAAGTLRLYRQAIGGRQMPAFLGPNGLGSAVQPLMARNRITVYLPAGGNTTFSSLGAINPTTSGTPTAYAMNPATLLGRVRRAGWTSLATAGQFSGFRVSFALITREPPSAECRLVAFSKSCGSRFPMPHRLPERGYFAAFRLIRLRQPT